MHRSACRLILAVLALCAFAPSVRAQPASPREPRVASRESIAAAPDRKIERYAKLALAPNGTRYVLMASLGSDGKSPTIVELVTFDRAGKATGRNTIASFSTDDFWLYRTRLLALPSGELLVVTPDPNLAGVPGRGGLLRLSAEGKVLHRAPLHPPHDSPDRRNTDYTFDIVAMAATSDGNVVVGGSYGFGPNSWWWAKFTPNGVRLAEQSAQFFFLSTVDALSPTPDGGFLMVFRDFRDNTSDVILQRHSAAGARLSRTLLLEKSEAHQAAFTSDGRIVVVKYGEPGRMLFFGADGKVLKEMPWTTPEYWEVAQLVSDGTGVVLREERSAAASRRSSPASIATVPSSGRRRRARISTPSRAATRSWRSSSATRDRPPQSCAWPIPSRSCSPGTCPTCRA
jgi:hypothetical protein